MKHPRVVRFVATGYNFESNIQHEIDELHGEGYVLDDCKPVGADPKPMRFMLTFTHTDDRTQEQTF